MLSTFDKWEYFQTLNKDSEQHVLLRMKGKDGMIREAWMTKYVEDLIKRKASL